MSDLLEAHGDRPRKRAFFVINSLVGGGAERVFSTLVAALRDQQAPFDIEIVLLDELPRAYSPPPGLRLHQLDCRESFAASVRQLCVLAWRERPDVLFSFLNRSNCAAIIAARLIGKPVIVSERVHTTSHFGQGASAAINRLAVRLLYPRATRVIAVSHGVADDLRDSYSVDPRRIEVIYNPVQREHILAQAAQSPEIALPARYWLAIGRLVPNKNFQMLLQAFALARPDGDLVILGEGPERQALVALASELGISERLHLPGFAANPFSILKRALGYLSASNAEGFPNALVEALVVGRPVAATDCDSGPGEILRGWNEKKVTKATKVAHGILVPTNNAEAMAEAIRLLSDGATRGQFADAALTRARDFDPALSIARYLATISACLEDSRP